MVFYQKGGGGEGGLVKGIGISEKATLSRYRTAHFNLFSAFSLCLLEFFAIPYLLQHLARIPDLFTEGAAQDSQLKVVGGWGVGSQILFHWRAHPQLICPQKDSRALGKIQRRIPK